MKKLFLKILSFYYTSYYKFFKLWQSDDNAADNAKGMISLNILIFYLAIVVKFILPLFNKEKLNRGSNLRFLLFLLCIPIIYSCIKLIKSYYPNNVKKDLFRGIIVSITLPIFIFLFIFFLKK